MEKLHPHKILIIQTAYIGDVILATSIIENIAKVFPNAKINFLLRKGNESILKNNPHIENLLIWDKKNNKYFNLIKIIKNIRATKYDILINIQRFASTGLISALSNAKNIIGFKKNPFSFTFTKRIEHTISNVSNKHEIERNHLLIKAFLDENEGASIPKLYPNIEDYNFIKDYITDNYIIIAPASVWFTKQMPLKKWVELIKSIDPKFKIILIGSSSDIKLSDKIIVESGNNNVINLCGRLSFLQSAAIMQNASRCFVNDSAPLHIASAVNAKITAIFCSTIPGFGFGPLAYDSIVIEAEKKLDCRPCGLHGKSKCPRQHFDCGNEINVNKLVRTIE